MASCTFFGHRLVESGLATKLLSTIEDMILHKNVTVFYVGNHGEFDSMARNVLRKIKSDYSYIKYYVVLAYLPSKKREFDDDWDETIFPEGLETVPKRLAIIKRNEWMIEKSDYVITYITHEGNASKFAKIAEKKKKQVINITE